MKRGIVLSFFPTALVLLLAACGGGATTPMQLTVTASLEEGTAPLAVDFTARVSGGAEPLTFSWDFGDGNTSSEQNPSHTFEQAGEYTISCTASDADGKTASASTTLLVYAPLEVQVTADPAEGLAPLLVKFSSTASGGKPPYTYLWDFGDGASGEGAATSHLFIITGLFEVTLTVSDSLGNSASGSSSVAVADDHTPVASITASPTAGPAPLEVQFAGNVVGGDAPYTFSWDFGDGEGADIQNPLHLFAQPGSYNVILVVADGDGDESSATATIEVVPDSQPQVSIQASPLSGLAPLTVQFSSAVSGGNQPLSYSWDFGDGSSSSEPQPSHLYAQDGDYTAVLTVSDADGDSATAQVDITAIAPETPVVTVAAAPETGPAPLAVSFSCTVTGGSAPYTYLWDFGDGTQSTLQNPGHTYTQIGDYQASCTAIDQFGQSGQGSITVSAQDPNQAPVIDDLTVANGWENTTQTCAAVAQTMVQLVVSAHDDNNDVLTYQWSFDSVPAGSTTQFNNPGVMNPTFVPDLAGDYVARVRVEDGRGGLDSRVVTITAENAGAVQAVSPQPPEPGPAGQLYQYELEVRLTTQCGIPYQGGFISWSASNGRVVASSGASDDQGLIQAQVVLGCDIATPALFTAYLPADPDTAAFSVPVEAGPAVTLFIEPQRQVPVLDVGGNPQPLQVQVRLADHCGNQASGDDVSFDLHVDPASTACFDDLCPSPPGNGSGVKDLFARSTSGGSAGFELYATGAGPVDIWADNLSNPLLQAGGMREDEHLDLEGWDGGFVSWSTAGVYNDEWAWGRLAAGPARAHSGNNAWASVLDGDYHPASGEDDRFLFRGFNLPCSPLVFLDFWEYHQLGPDALLFLSVNDPLNGQYPPPADGDSAYDGELNGRPGYRGDSGGWRRVRFDLGQWACNWVPVIWNLYLDDAAGTAFGWAIDDVSVEYFAQRAQGSFVAGPPWDGVVWGGGSGVAGCATSPGYFTVAAWDAWSNNCLNAEVQVSSDGAGNRQFTDARDGWIVSQSAGDAVINLGPWGWTDVWLTDDRAETVDITLLSGSGSNPSDGVIFVAASSDEVGLCDDFTDNDCDGAVDCDDSDCLGDPSCLPALVAAWHSASFQAGEVRYDYQVCNYTTIDVPGSFPVAIYVKAPGDPAPAYPNDPDGLWGTRIVNGLPGWSCQTDSAIISGLPPGDYALWFVADWTDTVNEGDKSDNVVSYPALVTVPAATAESDTRGNCLDAADNDFDGLQDCEDASAPGGQVACRSSAATSCDNDADIRLLGQSEPCNGVDDIGWGLVDALSCNCVNDSGCDDLDPNYVYRCYTELAPTGYQPVCSLPCYQWNPSDDLCLWLSGGALTRCDTNTGACVP
ncbi:MAG: hypothetical protein DRI34_04105 [Deltaproteobacteria bacterium]|nr:MAG: hypothetical protein DRI34_04105 [Deltaproteobacteria bacterium]